MRRSLASVVVAVACAFAAPALAHHNAEHEERGSSRHVAISHERAVEIARGEGVAIVREVDLRDGNWKVEGRTQSGREIEVEIDANSGEVVKRELY